jgi:hypothetical protein
MYIEAIKDGDRYILPINGKKEKIKVYIEEDIEELDINSLLKFLSTNERDISKEELKELYGEELYRKYLLLDKKSMEENWEYLVMTQKDWGDGFEAMEEAITHWNKE